MAIPLATLGFATTSFTIAMSCVPQQDDPNKMLAVLKVVGGSVVLVAIGAGIYWAGKRRAARLT